MEMDVEVEDEMLEEGGESTGDQPAHIDYRGDKRGPDCEGGDCAGDEGEGEGGHKDYKQEGVEATDELVEQITKRVAARILKSALAKK